MLLQPDFHSMLVLCLCLAELRINVLACMLDSECP